MGLIPGRLAIAISLVAAISASALVGCAPRTKQEQNIAKNHTPKSKDDFGNLQQEAAQVATANSQAKLFVLPNNLRKRGLIRAITRLSAIEKEKLSAKDFTQLQLAKADAGLRLLKSQELLSPAEKLFAVNTRIDALVLLRSINHPGIESELHEFSSRLTNDRQEDVAVKANLALLRLELEEQVLRAVDLQPFFDSAAKLVKKYPENHTLVSELQSMIARFFTMRKRDAGIRLMRLLADEYGKSENREFKKIGDLMKEQVFLAENEFDIVVDDLQKRKTGSEDRFENAIKTILQNHHFSIETYRDLEESFRVLEVLNKYELAGRINLLLEDAIGTHRNQNVSKAASHDLQMSKRRLSLLDQPFEVEATTRDGQDFNWEIFRDEVVLVVFWSANTQASVDTLAGLVNLRSDYANQGFDILMINVDVSPDLSQTYLGPNAMDIVVLTSDRRGDLGYGNDLSAKFGIRDVPYLMIVDRDKIVRDINVNLKTARSTINRYLTN